MQFLDSHPAIVRWSSEPVKIPYVDPITKRSAIYVPDFFVEYMDRSGKRHVELVEIKPRTQAVLREAKTEADMAKCLRNEAKWKAASAWARSRGIGFRVLTEDELFHRGRTGRRWRTRKR